MRKFLWTIGILLIASLAVPVAQAQPYGGWIIVDQDSPGWIEVPHSNALNPGNAMTLEAWVFIGNTGNCVSIAGKGWTTSYWLGVCNGTLRSYVRGSASARTAGAVPTTQWTHIAVTYGGGFRRHYINGEIAGEWAEGGAVPPSNDPFMVARDADWFITPTGTLDEVRLWNRALTTAEIRANINQEKTSPEPGLVAVYGMNGADDSLGNFDGTLNGDTFFLTFPVALSCNPTTVNQLCLQDRFSVTGSWRKPDDETGPARVVTGLTTPESGILWFFAPTNWEVMVKVLDACPLVPSRYWVFTAGVTNVFYRLEVFDIRAGVNKIYFNYPGPPAPAVTDTNAFATCP
ncbi:MAG: LamG domain-containing protein [Acidobacteriota bacterium]